MIYLKRKIDLFLKEWKKSENKKPLIVKGARQVGKTEAIKKFGKENYSCVIYINFVESPIYKSIISDGYNAQTIVKNITLLKPDFSVVDGETLIIFDELQEFPEIATALKFFAIDKTVDVICSGSMLGINYKRIESNSVGYKLDYEMSSMDFEEFLWAKAYDDSVISEVLDKMLNLKPFSELELSVFNSLFIDYCVLGGMPEVVRTYIERGTFEGSLSLQRQLIRDYEEDIRKYAGGMDQTRILNVFRHIPVQLAKENKKFQITKVAHGARFKDYRGSIEWLEEAGIINCCYSLNYPELPLRCNYEENKYKIYLCDTGLLIAMMDEETQMDLRSNKNLGVYKGAIYENLVAEALVKSGYSLYYYKRGDSTLELDFFVRTGTRLIPIEVKAANNQSKSLRTLINDDRYTDIEYGIKLAKANIGYSDKIYTFPYFCSFLLKEYLSEKP